MIVQLSAGQGPEECQIAVGKLFYSLKKEFAEPFTWDEEKEDMIVTFDMLPDPS